MPGRFDWNSHISSQEGAVLKYYLAGKIFSHRSPLPLPNPPPTPPINLVRQKMPQVCAQTRMKPVYCKQKHVCTFTHTLTQTNFSFACKSLQSPGMGSAHLCVAEQQVPIPILCLCCCSGCAHPPSNLEVNPPQTSPGMPCWPCVCVCPCVFLPIFHLRVSSLQFLMEYTHDSPNPWQLADQTQQSMDSLGIKVTLWLHGSWIFLRESDRVEQGGKTGGKTDILQIENQG